MLVDGDAEVTLLEESSRRCRGREHCFMVSADQYELVLQAQSEEERDDWVTFLRQQTRGDTGTTPRMGVSPAGDRDDVPILATATRSESLSAGSVDSATRDHGLRADAGSAPPDAPGVASADLPTSAAGAADEPAAARPASATSLRERPSALARLRKARKANASSAGGSHASSSASRLARIRRPSMRGGLKSTTSAAAEVNLDPARHVRLNGAVREGEVVELLALDGGRLAGAGSFVWYRTPAQVCESEDDVRRCAASQPPSGGDGGGGDGGGAAGEASQPAVADTDAAAKGESGGEEPKTSLDDAPSSSTSASSSSPESAPAPRAEAAAAAESGPERDADRGKRKALAARLASGGVAGSVRVPGATRPSFRPSADDVGSFLCCVYEPRPAAAKQQQQQQESMDTQSPPTAEDGEGKEAAAEPGAAGAPAGDAAPAGEAEGGEDKATEGGSNGGDGGPLVVCTRRAVGPMEPVVTRAHLKLLPHEHTLHCDRAERVCTAMGRWREGECVSLQVKGGGVDPARTLVRWQRQRCDDAEVLAKAGAIASSRAAAEAWKRDGERAFGPWEDVVPSAVTRRRKVERARRSAQAETGEGEEGEEGEEASEPLTLATAPRYRFMRGDVGARIRCVVTPVSSRGVPGQDVEVAATAVVEAAPPKLLNLRIVGSPRPGGHLFAVSDYWGGSEGESEYWWVGIRRDGSRVGEYKPRVRLTQEQVQRGVVQLPSHAPDPALMTVDEGQDGGSGPSAGEARGAGAGASAGVDEPADGVVVGFGAPPIPSGTEGYDDGALRALEAAVADGDPRLLPVTEDMVGMRFKVKCRPRRKDGEDGQIVTSKLSARVEGDEPRQEADLPTGDNA